MDNAIIKFIMRKLRGLYKAFSRKKVVDTVQYTPLARVLSTFDLILLGFNSILPSNWHLAIEFLAMDRVGPAITILFAIAAITSMFTGLCYTELGTRMPRAGSAYIYSYVSIGEFLAFLMGWILILDYAINSVAIVCFLRTYIDRTFYEYHSIRDAKKKNEEFKKNFFNLSVSFKVDSLSYPDYIAFCVTLIFSVMLAFGTRKTSVMYKTFTLVNLFVILIVIIVGFWKADFSNWTSNCTETNYEFGNGGFMPCSVYMVDVIYGGFRCFHVFASFDCLTISGEEAKNPRRSIPIAIIASLTITFLVYFSFIMLITVLPSDYTRKDTYNLLIFNNAKKWNCIWSTMIEIGMISGLCANLLSSIFSLSRIIYAMASDGLVFKWMGNINSRFRSPIMATVCAVLLIGILVIISSYELWIMNTIIICKLRTYWIVASCVIILRYEQSETYDREVDSNSRTFVFIVKQLINANKLNHSTKLTGRIVTVFVFCYVILCICTTTLLSRYIYNMTEISDKKATFATPLVILAAVLVIILIFIYFQPVSDKELTFSVPLMPFLPGLSIFINMFFMVIKMDEFTWTLFSVWIAIGLGVYFLYGVWHSHIR